MTPTALAEQIEKHVRPETFPLAIRMLTVGEAPPEKARRPASDLKAKIAVCQGFGISRRYGWTLAIGEEDISCPLTKVAFGFKKEPAFFTQGFCCEGMYTKTKEAGAKTESQLPKFEYGKYRFVLVGPLARAAYEPHVVLLYANPAQVLRLLTASLFGRGGYHTAKFSGRIDCADEVIRTMLTGEPQVILPCYGDRIFGLVQDHEMAFAFPGSFADELVAGLEGTHKGGIRYPIPQFMRFTGQYPEKYQVLEQYFDKE